MNAETQHATDRTSLVVIDVDNNSTQYVLSCDFNSNLHEISVLLIASDECWKGCLSGERYFEEHTLNALRSGNKFEDNLYAFNCVRKSEAVYEFAWKLRVMKNGHEVLRKFIDKVELKKVSRNAEYFDLLKNVSFALNEKNKSLQEISKRNNELEESCEKAINELFNFAQQKEKFVNEIYSKFAAVLNEKKERIRNLLENGHCFINTAAVPIVPEKGTKRKATSKSKKNMKSSEDAIYEQDTEPEMDVSPSVPSTSKRKIK